MKKYKILNRCPKISPACVPLTYLGWHFVQRFVRDAYVERAIQNVVI